MTPDTKRLLKWTAGGAAVGGLRAGLPKTTHTNDGRERKFTPRERRARAVAGTVGGGIAGGILGKSLGSLSSPGDAQRRLSEKASKRKKELHGHYDKTVREMVGETGEGNEKALPWRKLSPGKLKNAMYAGFADEIEKIAWDPIEVGGMIGMGKVMTSNALARYGHHLAPLRRIGQEIAGVGARTAMQGKPMLSAPFRAVGAIAGDSKLMGLYENAHAGVKAMGASATPESLHAIRQTIQNSPATKNMPGVQAGARFAAGIPLESTGIRKAVDYGFTPVSQVGRDIGGLAQRGGQAVAGGVQRAAGAVGTLARRMVPTR